MVAESFDAKISQEQNWGSNLFCPTYFSPSWWTFNYRCTHTDRNSPNMILYVLHLSSLPCRSHMEAAIPSPPMFSTQMPGPGPVGFFLLPYAMVVLEVFSEPCLQVYRLHKRSAGSYHILLPVVLTSTSKHSKPSDFKVHCVHHFNSAYFTWATGLTISGPYKIS